MGDDAIDREGSAGIMLVESEGLIREVPGFLDSLEEADRIGVLAIGRPTVFERDQVIWKQNDPHQGIYLIHSGRVRTFYSAPSGREVTLAYWFPGNFLGAPNIFGGGKHMWCSSATQRTTATFLPGKALRQLTLQNATVAVALLDALAFKATCYSAMAQMLGTRSASERLQRLLLFLATVYGIEGDDGVMIGVSFTQGELASLIGATRQWVTVQLSRLQNEGILRYNRGIIVVRKPAALGLEF